jgi:hypothetical protein
MKHIDWKLTMLVAFACSPLPTGCGGSLDPDQDFSAGRAAVPSQYTSPGKAGAGGKDAGSPPSTASSTNAGWRANPDGDAGQSEGVVAKADAGGGGSWSQSNAGAPKPAAVGGGGAAATTSNSAMPPAAGSGAAGTVPAAACDFRGLVQMKCGNANCHGAPASGTGLDLTSASLAMRVEGRKGASACTDKLLIDKDHPEASMLYLKVTGTSCGAKMPLGGALTESEQRCFLTWIEGL